MKMSFHSHAYETHFHMKSFARSLALKKRHKTIRKGPIGSILRTPFGIYCDNGEMTDFAVQLHLLIPRPHWVFISPVHTRTMRLANDALSKAFTF